MSSHFSKIMPIWRILSSCPDTSSLGPETTSSSMQTALSPQSFANSDASVHMSVSFLEDTFWWQRFNNKCCYHSRLSEGQVKVHVITNHFNSRTASVAFFFSPQHSRLVQLWWSLSGFITLKLATYAKKYTAFVSTMERKTLLTCCLLHTQTFMCHLFVCKPSIKPTSTFSLRYCKNIIDAETVFGSLGLI